MDFLLLSDDIITDPCGVILTCVQSTHSINTSNDSAMDTSSNNTIINVSDSVTNLSKSPSSYIYSNEMDTTHSIDHLHYNHSLSDNDPNFSHNPKILHKIRSDIDQDYKGFNGGDEVRHRSHYKNSNYIFNKYDINIDNSDMERDPRYSRTSITSKDFDVLSTESGSVNSSSLENQPGCFHGGISDSNKIGLPPGSLREALGRKLMYRRRLILDTPFSTRSTISYGLIVYAKDTKRWALIQRKHSVEFLLFIRGLYRLTYLPLLLSCITKDEAAIIDRCLKGGPKVFEHVFLNELELSPKDLDYALIRMAESRLVVSSLLLKLDLSENKLKWTWPKGRLHISSDRETPFDCAKREFTEEVEITLPPPLYISDSYVSENVKTITGRNIESRYWIYIIPNEIPMTPPKSHPEVATRMWTDTETCKNLIHYGDKKQCFQTPDTRSGYIGDLFKQVIDMVAFIE